MAVSWVLDEMKTADLKDKRLNNRLVVRHSKYVTFRMAEVAVQRELFGAILERIQRFGVLPPLLQRG